MTGGLTIAFSPVAAPRLGGRERRRRSSPSNGHEYTRSGCGPSAAIDQSLGTAGRRSRAARSSSSCGCPRRSTSPSSRWTRARSAATARRRATAGYRVETSPDGITWTTAVNGTFTSAAPPPAQLRHADGGRDRRPLRPPDAALVPGRRRPVPGHGGVRRLRPGRAGWTPRRPRRPWRRAARRSCSPRTSRGTFECKVDARVGSRPARRRTPWRCPTASTRSRCGRVDAARQRRCTPATRTSRSTRTAPETAILGPHPALTRDTTPSFSFASSPPGRRSSARSTRGVRGVHVAAHDRALADGPHTFAVRAIGGEPGPDARGAHVPRRHHRARDGHHLRSGRRGAQRTGRVRGRGERGRDVRVRARRRRFGSCATTSRAEDLSLGEHVYRARATDRAGNLDATPAEWRFTVVNAAPGRDARARSRDGPAPHTPTIEVRATDADGDRLTYKLDFGDGQTRPARCRPRSGTATTRPGSTRSA